MNLLIGRYRDRLGMKDFNCWFNTVSDLDRSFRAFLDSVPPRPDDAPGQPKADPIDDEPAPDAKRAGVMVSGMVFNRGDTTLTNSVDVAAFFGKGHRHVLRDIDSLMAHSPDLGDGVSRHFIRVIVDHQLVSGRKDRTFDMDRTGLTLLAMGFTGAKALKWKLLYIEAFDKMEAALRSSAGAGPNLFNDAEALRNLLISYTGRVIELEGENAALESKVNHLEPQARVAQRLADVGGRLTGSSAGPMSSAPRRRLWARP